VWPVTLAQVWTIEFEFWIVIEFLMMKITQNSIFWAPYVWHLWNYLHKILPIEHFPAIPKDRPDFLKQNYLWFYSIFNDMYFSIFNNSCSMGINITKPHYNTTSLHPYSFTEGFPRIPRAQPGAKWFGRSSPDKQNKQTAFLYRICPSLWLAQPLRQRLGTIL